MAEAKKKMGKLFLAFLILRFLFRAFKEYLLSWFVGRPSQNLFLEKNFAPISEEMQKSDLEIVGKIPQDLQGQYVKNGPNPQLDMKGKPYHWFDGDGMLHGVEISGGKASYINRWIRTQKWNSEKKAGKPLDVTIGSMNTPLGFLGMFVSVFLQRIKNKGKSVFRSEGGTANTALVYHDGRLLALVESSLPTHVRVPSLETIGVYNYNGKLGHPVTAHPKVDLETGEMFFFGYSFQGPFLHYSYVAKDGSLTNSFVIQKPTGTMIHDFGVTKNYAIFPDLPLVFRLENMLLGKPLIQFEHDGESRFGILPRTAKDQSSIRWFKSTAGYFFHTVNSWEEGNEIFYIACRSEDVDLIFPLVDGEYISKNPPRLYEWRFNLQTGETKERVLLNNISAEFPVINPRFAFKRNRFIFTAILSPSTLEMEGILKYDYQTGEAVQLRFGKNKFGGEPFFVERKGAVDEDDGYLFDIVHDYSTNLSECWIVDAKTMGTTPLARIKLPQRVPYGFHGRWVSAEEVAQQKAV